MLFKEKKLQLEHLDRKIDAIYNYLGLEYREEGEIHKSKHLTVTIKESKAVLKEGESPMFVVLGSQCGKVFGYKGNNNPGRPFKNTGTKKSKKK